MKVVVTLSLVGVIHLVSAQSQQPLGIVEGISDDCHNACNALTHNLAASTFYGALPGDFRTSYTSQQQREVVPACVIRPSSAQEVSSALGVIRNYGCHFAVKSGGHTMFKGASNAVGGVTIDLVKIRGIEVSEDRGTVKVGAGLRWGEVYEVLETQRLTVVGGRDVGVGVGGFLLGERGNLVSFETVWVGYGQRAKLRGWYNPSNCMNSAQNAQVVLANGSIANVNFKSHPDLYWALRGGGNNFGIVTRFDLESYEQAEVWGGNNLFLLSDIQSRRDALGIKRPFNWSLFWFTSQLGHLAVNLGCLLGYGNTVEEFVEATESVAAESRGVDPYSQLYMSAGYVANWDAILGTAFLTNSKMADPPTFDTVKALIPLMSTNRMDNISALAKEITSWDPIGKRQVWQTATFRADARLFSKFFDIFIMEIETIKQVPGVMPCFVMQPISQIAVTGNSKNGGNPMGITETEGPLLMFSIPPYWDNAEDDEVMNAAMGRFMDRAIAVGKEMGLYHPFIYQNYANGSQDVFGGYGEKSRKQLIEVQQKYDPTGIFSKLQPGHFKLSSGK